VWVKSTLAGGGGPQLVGPRPNDEGKPLDPANQYGHDVLWWLDRMVRSQHPLVEKMTLFWHDHFATNDQDTPLMLAQNQTLRRGALGSFRKLLEAVTLDPAMQMFLSLADSNKDSPNENYARELMELFTLGGGYSEDEIREAARALTGFESKYSQDSFQGIVFNPDNHDPGVKRIFGRQGRFGHAEVLDLVCAHRNHAPFLVTKLWNWFMPDPPSRTTVRHLSAVYRHSGLKIKPVVAEILANPALYRNLRAPDMIKAPVVYVAGTLRAAGQGITSQAPAYMSADMGQRLFDPPSVAGWDGGTAWMSSNSMRVRFDWGNQMLEDGSRVAVPDGETRSPRQAAAALVAAAAACGRPWYSTATRTRLLGLAAHFFDDLGADADAGDRNDRANMLQRSLRHALITGPDAQLH